MNRTELKLLQDELCGIYKITSPTNRIYIGQSKNIKNRYRNHLHKNRKLDTKLRRSFRKYGVEHHTFEIVELCTSTVLSDREDYYTIKYKCLTDGLNIRDTKTRCYIGSTDTGSTWTDERRSTHSKFMKNLWKDNPDYHRRDELFKEKISKKSKGNVVAKDKNGNYVRVSVDEYKKRDDLVGVTSGVEQPKLKKQVKCITDGKLFESLKSASKYYGLGNSNLSQSIKKNIGIGHKKYGQPLYFKYM